MWGCPAGYCLLRQSGHNQHQVPSTITDQQAPPDRNKQLPPQHTQHNVLFTPHAATHKVQHAAPLTGTNNVHNCNIRLIESHLIESPTLFTAIDSKQQPVAARTLDDPTQTTRCIPDIVNKINSTEAHVGQYY